MGIRWYNMGYNRFGQNNDSSLPIGATVPTVVTTNDPSKPNWLNLSLPNTLVDITLYPSFTTVTQSNLTGSALPTDNLSTFLSGSWLTGEWSFWYVDGLYWVTKDDNTASYTRVWTSVDGITYTEKANLTKGGSSYLRPEQIVIRKLSDGYVYVLATTGIYRTNNSGTTWTHILNPPSSYWGDIAYNGTTYVLSGGAGSAGVETTTDFVTFTQRHTLPYGSGSGSAIVHSPTFSKFYIHSGDSSGNHYVSYSSDGISGWVNVTLTTGVSGSTNTTGCPIVEFQGNLVIFLGGSSSYVFKSGDGTTWTQLSGIQATYAGTYYRNPVVVTADALYYSSSSGTTISYINSVSSPVRRIVGGLGSSTMGGLHYDTVNNRIVTAEFNSGNSMDLKSLPYKNTTNKVVMPIQNNLVRIY